LILSSLSFFDLPVSAIVAPNPHDATQLIAFAMLRDQSAASLIEVLTFLRSLMGGDSPGAFIIDWALGKKVAVPVPSVRIPGFACVSCISFGS
jgi:hypothetical protein